MSQQRQKSRKYLLTDILFSGPATSKRFLSFTISVLMLVISRSASAGTVVANCRNAAGDGAIIQTALSAGSTVHIVGPCDLDSSISFTTPGQKIYGDGRTVTVLNVSTILSTGAFVFNTGDPGPEIDDLGIAFSQPNVAVRSGLTAYTPAIYALNTPHVKLRRLRISGAMVGINGSVNFGGSVIDDLEMSAFSIGIWLDNTADSVVIDKLHFWPFGTGGSQLTANQQLIVNAPNGSCTPQSTSGTAGAVGIYSGRMDDLKVSNSLLLTGQGMCLFHGTGSLPGDTFGEVSNTGFDTFGGIVMNAGTLAVSSSYFSLASDNYISIQLNSGNLQCAGCNFQQGLGFGSFLPIIGVTAGNLAMSGIYVNIGNADTVVLETGGGNVSINGLQLDSTGTTQSNPKFAIGGSTTKVSLHGITPNNPITSGTLIDIANDNYHNVTGNSLNAGWGNVCAAVTHAVYANNGSGSAATCN